MYCDRCGKEFKKWNHKHKETLGIAELMYDSEDPYLDFQKDLCEFCYIKLVEWWNSCREEESEGIDEDCN